MSGLSVVLVSHTAGLGGAELALVELVRSLVGRPGLDLCVLVPDDGPLVDACGKAGARTERFDYDWWGSVTGHENRPQRMRRNGRAALSLIQRFRRDRPDVVVTNTVMPPSASLAARALRIPHVWYIHEFGVLDHGIAFDLGWHRTAGLIGRLSDVVIANSYAVRQVYTGPVPEQKLRVVYYGVETGKPVADRRDPTRFRLVVVGELKPSKGQADAISAAALLRDRGYPVDLHLVGAGLPERVAELRRLAAALDVEPAVHFEGHVADPTPFLATADVALMCSRSEAFGRVTIEAMKAGRPVVGGRSGATSELIADGVTGLLYETGDATDLAAKLARLAEDRELARSMGETAQDWSSVTFTPERYGASFEAVLRSVASSTRR